MLMQLRIGVAIDGPTRRVRKLGPGQIPGSSFELLTTRANSRFGELFQFPHGFVDRLSECVEQAFLKFEAGQKRKIEATNTNQTAPQSAQDRRESILRTRLKETLHQLSKHQPEAFSAFEEFLQTERFQARRFSELLTDVRREEYLRSLEGEEFRITQFRDWLRTKGSKFEIWPRGTDSSSRNELKTSSEVTPEPEVRP
jgi:hypothetical protein